MIRAHHDSVLSLEAHGHAGADLHVSLRGRLGVNQLPEFQTAIARMLKELAPKSVLLDLSRLDYLDTSGAMAVKIWAAAPPQGLAVRLEAGQSRFHDMLALIDVDQVRKPAINPDKRDAGMLESAGRSARRMGEQIGQLLAFVGQATKSVLMVVARPATLRMGDVLAYMQQVGVDGLPIVALIGLLLGMIMAFMSSLQLKSFGADVYVATLVAVAMVRELGPIMTAILVAGRSGSSFAAEIGTMKVNEEVDALTVMGYDPVIFLALPKIIAAVLMVPLLTLFSIAAAIMGGLIVGVAGLDLTPYTYLNESISSFDAGDLLTSMFKAAVFGLLIAVIGCQKGFTVEGGAAGVGKATTSAVVAALFLIIVTDSVFAIIQYYFL